MGTFVEGMKKNYFISAILTIALGAVLVIWPDVMIRLPARMPCEYGPIAAGAFSVAITFFNSGFHLLGVRIVYHRRKTLSI